MPFDPAKPVNNAPVLASELRAQFTGLKELIDNIPAGPQGDPGPEGPQGEPGPPGADGEVTNAAMEAAIDAAIAGTAQNPSGIAPFGGSFSDPPTQAEMQDFAAYVESLRAATVR